MIKFLLNDNVLDKIKVIRDEIPKDMVSIFDTNFRTLSINSEISFNYFALGFREIINRTIATEIDMNDLKQREWFPHYFTHQEDENKVSTKQKLLYMSIKKHSADFIFKLYPQIYNRIEDLYTIVQKLNKYVHLKILIEEEQFKTELENIIIVFGNFFETLNSIKKYIEELIVVTQEGIRDSVMHETIQSFDEIATGYSDFELEIENIIISGLLEENNDLLKVQVMCFGTAYATLQYGSNADQRRGDGVTMPINFPLESEVHVTISNSDSNLEIVDVEVEQFNVDNESWYEE